MPKLSQTLFKLFKIPENNECSEEEDFPTPKSILHKNENELWREGFDSYEDYQPNKNDTYRIYSAGKEGPIVFCIHGAGASGLSFTLLAKHSKSFCRMIAPDLRGHGHTFVTNEKDLSAETLTNDCIELINHILPDIPDNARVPIILIGHSMGGGVAVQIASHPSIKKRIRGLIVIDVVEGSALDSLSVMMNVLRRKPQEFYDYEDAIDWSIDSNLILNRNSARISIPDQLIPTNGVLKWRTNLFETEPFWVGWYKNMSNRFLENPAVKVLMVAGHERLDTPLTIGHMQGKFQLMLFNGCGHFIHEDIPGEIAAKLHTYLQRYNFIGNLSDEEALRQRIERERMMY